MKSEPKIKSESDAASMQIRSAPFAERAVFNYIVNRLEVTAPELCRRTGMPGTTIAGILNRLVARGFVVASSTEATQRGRPSIRYRVRIPRSIFACQLDATQVAAAVFDRDLNPRALEVESFGNLSSVSVATEAISGVLARVRSSLPMSIDQPTELALSVNAAPLSRLQLLSSVLPWVQMNLADTLSEKLMLQTRVIPPMGPLIAENQRVTDPVPESFIRFHIGDGVSAHAVIGGESYQGYSHLAGEIGHVTIDSDGPLCGCGRRGCLEVYCAGPALHRRLLEDLASGVTTSIVYEKAAQSSPRTSMSMIWEAWQLGDSYANDFMRRVFELLGSSIGTLMNLLDPELVLASGYVLERRPEWVKEIIRKAEQWTMFSRFRPIPLQLSETTVEDELRVTAMLYFYEFNEKKTKGISNRRRLE
jgi:N-acetylglucosamine repressor